jgi:hypothetical protein
MDTLRARIAAALAPRYVIEADIGSGGMGHVYRVPDIRLDRRVAVKVLRPELATARNVERFAREKRLLARLNHPNILAIHDSDPLDGDGLMYYVMDFAPGETLAAELTRGALPPAVLRRLAEDMLGALAHAHESAVIHRDIKPSNIFRLSGRYMLGDFGIARLLVESVGTEPITDTGAPIGTLAYMAPEQLAGSRVTPAADIYSAGLVLYEAATGRPWAAMGDPRRTDWKGVPGWLRRLLRRALTIDPARRWPDATEMLAALRQSGSRRAPSARAYAVTLAALVVAAFIIRPGSPPALQLAESDLALVPFRSASGTGRELAQFTAAELEWSPRWSFRPFGDVLSWWDSAGVRAQGLTTRRIRSRWWGEGQVVPGDGMDTLFLIIRDSSGSASRTARVPGDSADLVTWAGAVADTIVRQVYPQYFGEFRELSMSGRGNFAATRALVNGLGAFAADDWDGAERQFSEALVRDPSLARAAWELQLLALWRRSPPPPADPRTLAALPAPYGTLLETMDEPDLRAREARLTSLGLAYPGNSRARLLLFDEQLHRGPLIGIPLRKTLDDMRASAARDPYLDQVAIYDHLLWGYTHLGDATAARDMWNRRAALRAAHGGGADTLGELYNLARIVRFGGVKGMLWSRLAIWKYGKDGRALAPYLRLGGTFDIPAFQRSLAEAVQGSADSVLRPTALVAHAVAAFELGDPPDGFRALDSAATLFGTDEMRFQRIEWRMLPFALGLPLTDSADAVHAAAEMRLLPVSGPEWQTRALWAVGTFAALRGDSSSARQLHAALPAPDAVTDIRTRLLQAMLAGATDPREGLRQTDSLFVADLGTPRTDPFERSVLHLVRADWQLKLGLLAAADSSLRWYENSDLRGWPDAAPQAGEVDQVLSVMARVRRADVLLQLGQRQEACQLLRRSRELWRRAGPEFTAAVSRAQTLARACP